MPEKNKMRAYLSPRATAAAALLLLVPSAALADLTIGRSVGTTIGQVATTFEADGYTVTEMDLEGNRIEADIIADNRKLEVKVDRTTGQILSVQDD